MTLNGGGVVAKFSVDSLIVAGVSGSTVADNGDAGAGTGIE